MKPKPSGLGPEYGEQFGDPSVVAAYGTRPPYPEQLIPLVFDIAGDERPRILDLGCGTGELARRLASRGASVTAVDRSWRMITAAMSLPGGDALNIEWVVGSVEDVRLSGAFTLALAAESFHWFDWPSICERLPECAPSRTLIIVEGRFEDASPWAGELGSLIAQSSTNREFEAYNLVDELNARGCFTSQGRAQLGPEPFTQSVNDYISCIHSRNGFSRDRMSDTQLGEFDAAVRTLVSAHAHDDMLDLAVATRVAWGRVTPR